MSPLMFSWEMVAEPETAWGLDHDTWWVVVLEWATLSQNNFW